MKAKEFKGWVNNLPDNVDVKLVKITKASSHQKIVSIDIFMNETEIY